MHCRAPARTLFFVARAPARLDPGALHAPFFARRRTRPLRLIARCCLFLSITFSPACGLDVEPHAGVGSLNLALTSQNGGVTYRLTDARFALEGPEAMGFASGDEPQVSMELMPGSYTLELLPGYRLVRVDDPQGSSVNATLLSTNPAPLLVEPGMTTQVALRFELADGTQVSNARGSLSVELDLSAGLDAGSADTCTTGCASTRSTMTSRARTTRSSWSSSTRPPAPPASAAWCWS